MEPKDNGIAYAMVMFFIGELYSRELASETNFRIIKIMSLN